MAFQPSPPFACSRWLLLHSLARLYDSLSPPSPSSFTISHSSAMLLTSRANTTALDLSSSVHPIRMSISSTTSPVIPTVVGHSPRTTTTVADLPPEQDQPLDLSMATLKKTLGSRPVPAILRRGGHHRPRNCPVPPMVMAPYTDYATTPLDLSVDAGATDGQRQRRRIKRPLHDSDYVTGEEFDEQQQYNDHHRDSDYNQTQEEEKKPVKRIRRSRKQAIKTSQEKKSGADDPVQAAGTTTTEVAYQSESGETVIVELKCAEPGCTEMLPSRDAYNRHLLYFHAKYPYRCLAEGCDKEFEIMGELGPHVRDNHSSIKNWPCTKCGRAFPTHRGLRHHMWYYHLEGRFACPVPTCSYEGHLPIEIKQHRYREHSPLYQCPEPGCERVFKQHSNLVRHGRTHSGMKPYRCNYSEPENNNNDGSSTSSASTTCTYSSEVRSHVLRHIRARHLRLSAMKKRDYAFAADTEQNAEKYLLVVG